MTSKTFTSGTVIDSAWLNDVNGATYNGTGVFTQAGTGAIARTVQDKARESVSVKDFGAVGGGVTDDTAAIQAAINYAMLSDKSLYIPAGDYKITGPLSVYPASSCYIYGDGNNTRLVATSFSGGVLQIFPTNDWSSTSTIISKLSIISSVITSNQFGVLISDASGTSGVRMDNIYVKGFETGFDLTGSQFCSFSNLSGTNCTAGLVLRQSTAGGGGNNNTFYDCWFSSNVIGVMLYQSSVYPFHNNKFINLVTHSNTTCAVYVEGMEVLSIENWAPESNGAGASSYTFNGKVVKAGILHSVKTITTLRNYDNVSNINPLTLETNSSLCFDGYTGATLIPIADTTSFFTFSDASAKLYEGNTSTVFANTPVLVMGGANYKVLALSSITNTGAIPNDALSVAGYAVNTGYTSGGTANTNTFVVDAQMGYVLSASYANTTSSLIMNTAASSYTGIGSNILFSAMVKSSNSTASWVINFGQSTVVTTLTLPANVWCRVVLVGVLSATPRSNYVSINATASAIGETLRICKIQTNSNVSNISLASIVRNNLFNPGTSVSQLLRLSAAPVAETWAVGDIVYNTAPSAGGFLGWVCTTAGTPGTWKTFGAITP